MSISKVDETQFWINEYGLLLFRNKFNKDLVLKRPYHWCEDNYLVIDEGRQNLIVETPKLHEIDFDDWTPITKEEYQNPNPDYKNAPVNLPYGDDIKFVDVKDDSEEKLAEGFVKGVFEIIELKKENKKLQEMFAMQVKLVTALEVEKMELEKGIKNACQYAQENLKSSVELTDKVKQLELDNEELHTIIKTLTKGKLPCNPDHNGECLVCDCWLSDCPLAKNV